MCRDEFRHLEHRDLALAAEYRLQFIIGENVSLILRILKIILLDVYPKLFDHLRSRERTLAHDRLQFWRKVERFR